MATRDQRDLHVINIPRSFNYNLDTSIQCEVVQGGLLAIIRGYWHNTTIGYWIIHNNIPVLA